MISKSPIPSTKSVQLSRLGIITRDDKNNTITIDVEKLLKIKDCEILECKGFGMFRLIKIRQAIAELKSFLFENIKQ